jgi:hypothetical protein
MFTGELRADLSLDMEKTEPEEPAKPTSPAAVDWTAELRQEQVEGSAESGQPPEQPGTGDSLSALEGIDIPLDRMPRMTGQLRSAFTGFLRGPDEEAEITDDMLTGRLGGMETPALSPERADNLPPLTGDLEDLRGKMPVDQTSYVTPASEAQEENLPEDRLGMFLERPPAAPIVPPKPFEPSASDLDRVAEDMWKEPPVYSQQQPQPEISIEDIWGAGSENTQEPAEDQAAPGAAEIEVPPEVPTSIRTAQLMEPEPDEAKPPAADFPVPAEPLSPAWLTSLDDIEVPPVAPEAVVPGEAVPGMAAPDQAVEEAIEAPAEIVIPKPTDEDLSSLRETLTSEDARKRRGSGLFKRITGSLRRVTGSLGGAGSRAKPAPLPEEKPGDAEEFVSGRLSLEGTSSVPAQPPDLQSTFADIYAVPSEEAESAEQEPAAADEEIFSYPSGQPAASEPAEQTGWMNELRQETTAEGEDFAPTTPTPSLQIESSQPRGVTGQLRSFITSILRGPGERKRRTAGLDISDDVVTGRLERTMITGNLRKERPAAEEPDYLETPQEPADLPPGTPQFDAEMGKTSKLGGTKPRGVTGQLRSFITSILRLPEEREKDTGILELPEVPVVPPKSVTGRLGSSVTAEPPQSETYDIWGSSVETSEPETAERAELIDDLYNFTPSEPSYPESAPAANLEEEAAPVDRFSMFFGDQATVDADETLEEEQETGEVQWGSRQGNVMPGDLPDIFVSEEDVAQQAEDQPVETWGEEEEEQEYPQTGSLFGEATDDDLIASYLGGIDLAVAGEEEAEAVPGSEDLTAYNLRSVALEGYQDIYEPKVQPAEEVPEGEMAEGGAALAEAVAQAEAESEDLQAAVQEKFNLKAWLAVRRNFRMILLAEVVLILLAALVMSPVFLAALRGTPQQARGPFLVAKPLPADVPYPTGVTFPGGWKFALQKSTFVEDNWQPKTAEWLEGTEVRRVLALPWNPQTEAVVQTFKPGDKVNLVLSNQDMVDYEITSIERVPVSDTSIYTDTKPSMVIILYEENAEERWVVTCRP